jgi:hypothetical protein
VHDGWRHGRWVHHESEDVASAQGKIRHDLRSCGFLGFVGDAIWRFVEYFSPRKGCAYMRVENDS